MVEQKTKEAVPENLIRMLSVMEFGSLVSELGLPVNSTTEDAFERLRTLPRYEAVRLFLKAADVTLNVLRDIFLVLERLGVAVRTKGCVFILASPSNLTDKTEVAFSPQTVGTVCRWPSNRRWKRPHTPFQELKTRWDKVHRVLYSLTSKSDLNTGRGRFEFRPGPAGVTPIYKAGKESVNIRALQVLEHFLPKLLGLVNKFSQSSKPVPSKETTIIIREAETLVARWQQVLRRTARHRARLPHSPALTERDVESFTIPNFTYEFDRLLEDMYLLFDLEEAVQDPDLLRLDVWTTRPQLYEIWVMMSIIGWLISRGYKVELLQKTATPQGTPFRWNLSYSKDTKPCASISDVYGNQRYLFFQLYRPSKDMPDISLLSNSDPASKPIWSVDPKHSEKKGYKIDAYRETAERYRDSFRAELSIVVEYFDRSDVTTANPSIFSRNALLVHDCQPAGIGLPLLLKELDKFHPISKKALICLDLSQSFFSTLSANLPALRIKLLSDPNYVEILDEYVCFAGSAGVVRGIRKWLSDSSKELLLANNLAAGTSARPLVEAARAIIKAHHVTRLLLVSDGQFDSPTDKVLRELQRDFNLDVEVTSLGN
jgi:hypothetical protein